MSDEFKDEKTNKSVAPLTLTISGKRKELGDILHMYYNKDDKLIEGNKREYQERVKILANYAIRYGGMNNAIGITRVKDTNKLEIYLSPPRKSDEYETNKNEYETNKKNMVKLGTITLPNEYNDVDKQKYTFKVDNEYGETERAKGSKASIGEVIVSSTNAAAPPDETNAAAPPDETKAAAPPDETKAAAPPAPPDDTKERRKELFMTEKVLSNNKLYIYGPLGIPLPIKNANGRGTSIPEFLAPLVEADDTTGADLLAALEIWKRQGRKMAAGAREALDEEKRALEEQTQYEEASGGRIPISPFKNEWKEYFKMIDSGQYEAAASLRQAIYDSDKYKQYRKEILTNPEKLAEIASNEREANIGATQQQIAEKAHTTTKRYKRMNKKIQNEQNRLQKAAEKAGATLLEIKEEVDKQYANETNEVDKEQVRNAENEHEKRLVARKTADELQYTSTDTPQSHTNPFSMNVFTSTLHGDDYYRMRNNGRSVYNQYTTWNERGSVGDEVSNDEFTTKIYKTFYRYQGANIVPNS